MEIKRIGKKHPDPRPFKKTYKKYYEPLYGTPDCPYEGNKRGRKSMEERQRPTLKVEKKFTVLYFD
tara:strand:+ start:2713 stop:2910 length:198 start_codon:yes stop_codon:yes gene_type:complete